MTRPTACIALCLAALASAWWLTARGLRERSIAIEPPAAASVIPTVPTTQPAMAQNSDQPPGAITPPLAEESTMRPPPLDLSTTSPAWERQLLEARRDDAAAHARALFALFPILPEEALATAAELAVERLPDRDYPAIAQPTVVNAATAAPVLSVLFADLMERPDAITLPALLAIASDPAHPYSAPALENLRLLLQADLGNEWPKWQAAIERRLRSL